MIVPEDRTLMKNKTFLYVLAFGIILSVAGVIVRAVQNQKVASDVCASGLCYGDSLCYQSGYVYCCGSYSGNEYCGQQSDCYNMGEDCVGFVIAEWVLFGITVLVLIGLIVIARKHKLNAFRSHSVDIIQRQNIVYTDSNQRVGNINESISSEYHRV